jgi:putative redox protein
MSKAQVTWTGPGMRLVGEANEGSAIVLDSKGQYGTHSGPTPMELVLIGLAGCTAMDVISIMAKKRQPLKSLQVKVEAENADTHPKVYTKIHLEYIAYGEGVSASAFERAIELSEDKYCPANAMLSKTAEISTTYRIVEEPAPSTPGPLPEA